MVIGRRMVPGESRGNHGKDKNSRIVIKKEEGRERNKNNTSTKFTTLSGGLECVSCHCGASGNIKDKKGNAPMTVK